MTINPGITLDPIACCIVFFTALTINSFSLALFFFPNRPESRATCKSVFIVKNQSTFNFKAKRVDQGIV